MKIKSNLRWPGGKSKMIKNIAPFFPEEIHKYYELFAGGASVGIDLMQSQYTINEFYLNDIDADLCNYYRIIKQDNLRKEIINKILKIKNEYTSQSFKDKFDELKSFQTDDCFFRALKFFIINKCGFSGLKMSNYSSQAFEKNFTIKSILNIEKIGRLLSDKNVIIENSEFQNSSIIKKSNFFIYVDPPYYSNSKKGLYGQDGSLHKNFDHNLLHDVVEKIAGKNKVLVSYDDTEFIRNLYSNFKQSVFDKTYSMTNTGGNICKTGKELLIKNY